MWSYLSPHGKLRLEQHARSMVDAAALAHRIEWAVMYGDAAAGTHIDAASPAPAQPRRRVICAATRVHAHKGIGRGAADAAKRLESFAPPAKLEVHARFELGRLDRSHIVSLDAAPQFLGMSGGRPQQ